MKERFSGGLDGVGIAKDRLEKADSTVKRVRYRAEGSPVADGLQALGSARAMSLHSGAAAAAEDAVVAADSPEETAAGSSAAEAALAAGGADAPRS
jgi:hypothetical protein